MENEHFVDVPGRTGGLVADKPSSFIPNEIIETIRERADIIQLLSPYVPLKKAGKNYMAPCPFHRETKPSFTVNPVTQTFHCFGCGVGGNIFSFFMNFNNLSFPDAVQFIADRIGFQIPRLKSATPEDEKRRKERDVLLDVNREAASYFSKTLWDNPNNQIGRDYLEHRGVPRTLADTFKLGLAPPPWDNLYRHFTQKGYSDSVLSLSGLFIQRDEGKGNYDRFRSRLMFPIFNVRGDILGFAGRTLTGDDAKYINSPETPLFSKRKLLYGLYQSQEKIRRERQVLIVEGYFDLLMLFQSGIQNVVATCGTALTEDHLSLLRRFSRTVRLVFDGDEAGVAAAARSLEMIIERDIDVSVCLIPDGLDPDDFVRKHGQSAFMELLAASRAPFPFLIDTYSSKRDLSNPNHVIAFLDDITPFLRKITDPVRRSLIIRDVAQKAGIEHKDLVDRLRDKDTAKSGAAAAATEKKIRPAFIDYEIELIRLLLHYPRKIKVYQERLTVAILRNEQLGELLHSILSLWSTHDITHPDQWMQHWGLLPHQNLMTRFCTDDVVEANIDEQLLGCLNKAEEHQLQRERTNKKKALDLAIANNDTALLNQLTRDIFALTVALKDLHHKIK